jgi:predicted dehydrogenase
MRNWYYFVWLGGDHIVEQHIHNLDVANWVLQGYPVKARGMGGRQVRDRQAVRRNLRTTMRWSSSTPTARPISASAAIRPAAGAA